MAPVRRIVPCFFLAVLIAAPVNAESILFNTLGPGDAFDENAASFFGFDEGQEDTPDGRFARAMPFTPGSTAPLRSIDIALSFHPNFSPAVLVINLFAADGDLPGALLETLITANALAAGVHSFTSRLQPVLNFGQEYFVEATTTERGFGGFHIALEQPEENMRGADVFRNDNGPWRRAAVQGDILALRVTGTAAPVPEPASVLLVGTSAALLALRRRRGRFTRSAPPACPRRVPTRTTPEARSCE